MDKKYIWPKITADTPIKTLRELHRKIWGHAIAYGIKPTTPYIYNCALCEYSYECAVRSGEEEPLYSICEFCPSTLYCRTKSSMYGMWSYADDPELKRLLAEKIRDAGIDERLVKNTHPVIEE